MSKQIITHTELTTMIESLERKVNIAVECAGIANFYTYNQLYDNMLYGSDIQQRKIIFPNIDTMLKQSVVRLMMMRDTKEITEEGYAAGLNYIKTQIVDDGYKKSLTEKCK